MSIYKVRKRENPFVQIDKTMIQDNRLSFKAKGILTYLLSRPDNWQVYEVEIIKHAKDGRESVRSGIKELIDNGYIEREERRNERGHFKGYEYYLKDGLSDDELAEIESGIDPYSKVVKMKSQKKRGFVYLLRADNGLYKIGKSVDVKKRMDKFTIQLPYELEVVHVMEAEDYTAAEKTLHEKFKEYRKRGEWFELTEAQISGIKKLKF